MNALTSQSAKPLFSLGVIVSTPGALAATTHEQRLACLFRHRSGDWGCCDDEDKGTNDDAVTSGNRVLSAYPIDAEKQCKGYGDNTLWVITEADRSVTTFLLPNEY